MSEYLACYAPAVSTASRILRARAAHLTASPVDQGTLREVASRLDELVDRLGGVEPDRDRPVPRGAL